MPKLPRSLNDSNYLATSPAGGSAMRGATASALSLAAAND
jgi:hypothetical protein